MAIFVDREWRGRPPASADSLKRLGRLSPGELPAEYLALLGESDGGEGPLPVQPYWVQLDSADRVADAIQSAEYSEFLPGFIVIGSNGGGEYVALDIRVAARWPLVAIDMVAGPETALAIAPDFSAFTALVGVDEMAGDPRSRQRSDP